MNGPMNPFSKFEPERPLDDGPAFDTDAARRAFLLKWGTRVSYAFMVFGFLVIGYMLYKQR